MTNDVEGSLPVRSAARPRGRPRDPAKREALLATARALFFQDGADAVTMDQIIVASNVSRATLYANFRDKTELLEAVITRESARIVDEQWLEEASALKVDEALKHFGIRLLRLIADPEQLDCEKLISQAAIKTPEYGRRFFAAGPGRSLVLLTQLIEIGQANGAIAAADPAEAARDLMALWVGFWRTEVLFGVRSPPDAPERKAIVARGVTNFLRLYRP